MLIAEGDTLGDVLKKIHHSGFMRRIKKGLDILFSVEHVLIAKDYEAARKNPEYRQAKMLIDLQQYRGEV